MKKLIKPIIYLIFSGISLVAAESIEPLTNNVAITEELRLNISDDVDNALPKAVREDEELIADRQAYWMLRQTSSNDFASVIFLGMTNTFDVRLSTTNGGPISKTREGEAFSAGPMSRTNFAENPKLRRIGPGMTEFAKPIDLFNFPSNGIYILEVRYWTWVPASNQFCLSQPIRMRVVKNH